MQCVIEGQTYDQEELEVLTIFIMFDILFRENREHQLQINRKYSGVYIYLF